MSYRIHLTNAARRHLRAADRLAEAGARPHERCHDVAGYLYGVSAECALKQIMRDSGYRPLLPERRREDPFYAHFPDLKTMLRDDLRGRRAGELRAFVESDSFMNEWSTDMRYAPKSDIRPELVDRWRKQAHEVVETMGAA